MSDLTKIDKNFATVSTVHKDGMVFYSADQYPMRLYGVFYDGEQYIRMPRDVAASVNPGVESINTNTVGGRVRFTTDSSRIVISAKRNTGYCPVHMTYILVAGFDLYEDDTYVCTFLPNGERSGEQKFEASRSFDERRERNFTINFPAYGPVSELLIGIEEGATLKPAPDYTYEKPFLIYGSSITQGGCATRPGAVHSAHLSRWLDSNYINLGFSGSAKGEQNMAKYIASLDISALVMEYDHNAPNIQHLAETHEPFFKTIREAKPDLPIILATRPAFMPSSDRDGRYAVIKKTYDNAVMAGDKNVYFASMPAALEEIGNEGTVDGCHPNDLGFFCMAKGLYPALKDALTKK